MRGKDERLGFSEIDRKRYGRDQIKRDNSHMEEIMNKEND